MSDIKIAKNILLNKICDTCANIQYCSYAKYRETCLQWRKKYGKAR